MTDDRWWERGACLTAGIKPDGWCPGPVHSNRGWNAHQKATIAACVAVCAVCDPQVRAACHNEAMSTDGEVAIRAGLTFEDRAALRGGGRQPAACGTPSGYSKHKRNGETPCDPCRFACNAYQRERNQRTRA